ncbi:hypothetical protein PPTG_24959 [Phytophthora nicotianae INRA-310]|uniref:Uncharacterized protein n=1 Tax=Phytophthora nicotianae (strain INRA-310) TaxID=761204 RepID=W2PBQ6_PHYN3|nr:hypothetical protein PPTG_24959 [Phytophthora nicotianae INRA-310]ETM97419.1 hypothetical protein PPTG_24959 [Phytophthora nicotianae INRA-310]
MWTRAATTGVSSASYGPLATARLEHRLFIQERHDFNFKWGFGVDPQHRVEHRQHGYCVELSWKERG